VNERNLVWHRGTVNLNDRERRNGHQAAVVWFTGLSGSGKSTVAHLVEQKVFDRGCQVYVLDGDNVRHGLCSDLGFEEADRIENIRRIGEAVRLFLDAGIIVLTAFISPYMRDRQQVSSIVGAERYLEVFCDCPVTICEERDAKGLYKRARAGEIQNFTGISAPYEKPIEPSLRLETNVVEAESAALMVVELLKSRSIIGPANEENGSSG